ncbi:hypothetical protein GCM10027431_26450 [Lysobacter rhizosphaerae]
MKLPVPPHFDARKRDELHEELRSRARLWFPDWRADDNRPDVLSALLGIAASVSSEVTRRLDRVPEKCFRDLLHWLGKRGGTARSARMPVVFRMSDHAEPMYAPEQIRIQADADGTPVVFESESGINLVASGLLSVVATDAIRDRFYRAPDGLGAMGPAPTQRTWQVRTRVRIGSNTAQLDPPDGLVKDMILEDDAHNRYRIETAKDGIVTLSHGLGVPENKDPAPPGPYEGKLRSVEAFSPFDAYERNRQKHVLYLGADELLNISSACHIELMGISSKCKWSYWGKGADSVVCWQSIESARNVLTKDAGQIEKFEINGFKLRWLRAEPLQESVAKTEFASEIRFRIYPRKDTDKDKDGQLPTDPGNLEAVANTTPVVLNRGFHPLGREPRPFDAFHLSCPEAFGKPNVLATVEVRAGDGFSGPLSSVADAEGSTLAGGIRQDQRLQLVHVDTNADDPVVRFLAITQPPGSDGIPVKLLVQKVGVAASSSTCFVSATDGAEAWICRADMPLSKLKEAGAEMAYKWMNLASPMAGAPMSETCLIRDADRELRIYALVNGGVHWRPVLGDGGWTRLPVSVGNKEVSLARLAPFERTDQPPGTGSDVLGLVGITSDGTPLHWKGSGPGWVAIGDAVATPGAYPVALLHSKAKYVFWPGTRRRGDGSDATIEAATIDANDQVTQDHHVVPVPATGSGLSFVAREGVDHPMALFVGSHQAESRVGLWRPFAATDPYLGELVAPALSIEQPPVRIAGGYLLPLKDGAVAASRTTDEPFIQAAPTSGAMTAIALSDAIPVDITARVALELAGELFIARTIGAPKRIGFAYSPPTPPAQGHIQGRVHSLGRRFRCTVQTVQSIELDSEDHDTNNGDMLCLCRRNAAPLLAKVTNISTPPGSITRIAQLDPPLPNTADRSYYRVTGQHDLPFDIRPTVVCEGAFPLVTQPSDAIVEFAGKSWTGRLWDKPVTGANGRIIFDKAPPFTPAKGSVLRLILPPPRGNAVEPPTAQNPELSWEYWNGRTWWKIPKLIDGTRHLVRSGRIQFCVPRDLQPSDVAGRPGHWIRARLVGGDYGQERVWLQPEDERDGDGRRMLNRDPSAIRAPYIAHISVSYKTCSSLAPERVLTFDNGAYQDQTDLNRLDNASLAIFTPLADSLARATTQAIQPTEPQCCDACGDGAPAEAARSAHDKAIYLGFTGDLFGPWVSLLFLVHKEQEWTGEPPALEAEAFFDDAFHRLTIKDGTKALSESGIILLSFPVPLQRVVFFGQSLYWIRLFPRAFAAEWSPSIRGVYPNSVWVSAGETHRHEIVGLSDGSPNQVFRLAHSPVLDDTLELRVREPVSDQEIAALKEADSNEVVNDIGEWTGPWVRWRPGDLAAARGTDRVFDFDASVGTIVFGDGRNGAIPPIGSDNIVAVRYRSGGGAAANLVKAWSRLNLIGPLRGVEETFTPEGAAGGSDPQDPATVLHFAPVEIATRDRAVTLADFERLALQFSPDIGQAKAFHDGSGISLVIVMRGRQPAPTRAQRRELANSLGKRATSALRHDVRVQSPTTVDLKVEITLAVRDPSKVAAIAAEVRERMTSLLDGASGGFDGSGWPLGRMVSGTDVAARIMQVPVIDGIDGIEQIEVMRKKDGASALGRDQLAVLSADAVSIRFRTTEAA